MIKALKIVRRACKYISALLVMLGIMVCVLAACTEDISLIISTMLCGLGVIACGLPFSIVNWSIMGVLDRWGVEE